jgi:hypothetical protein
MDVPNPSIAAVANTHCGSTLSAGGLRRTNEIYFSVHGQITSFNSHFWQKKVLDTFALLADTRVTLWNSSDAHLNADDCLVGRLGRAKLVLGLGVCNCGALPASRLS